MRPSRIILCLLLPMASLAASAQIAPLDEMNTYLSKAQEGRPTRTTSPSPSDPTSRSSPIAAENPSSEAKARAGHRRGRSSRASGTA